jgi:hypothetical protein
MAQNAKSVAHDAKPGLMRPIFFGQLAPADQLQNSPIFFEPAAIFDKLLPNVV